MPMPAPPTTDPAQAPDPATVSVSGAGSGSRGDALKQWLNNFTGGGMPEVQKQIDQHHQQQLADVQLHAKTWKDLQTEYAANPNGKYWTKDAQGKPTPTPEGQQLLMQIQTAQQAFTKVAGVNKESKSIIGKLGQVIGAVSHHGREQQQEGALDASVPGNTTTTGMPAPPSEPSPATGSAPPTASGMPGPPNAQPASAYEGDTGVRAQQAMADAAHSTAQSDLDDASQRRINEENAKLETEHKLKQLTPKAFKPHYESGRLVGVEDPNSGEFYTDPAKMPAEAKEIYDQSNRVEIAKEKEKKDEEDRRFNRQLALQTQAFSNAIARNDYTTANKEVIKAKGNYQDAIDRQKTMDQNVKDIAEAQKSGKQNQQAMMSLLANHIGMTSGAQPKMRMSKAQWDEAKDSVPLLDRVEAKFDSDGYLSGVVLTNEQVNQMVELAHEKTGILKDHIDRVKDDYSDALGQKSKMPKPPAGGKSPSKKIVVTQEDLDHAK